MGARSGITASLTDGEPLVVATVGELAETLVEDLPEVLQVESFGATPIVTFEEGADRFVSMSRHSACSAVCSANFGPPVRFPAALLSASLPRAVERNGMRALRVCPRAICGTAVSVV